MASIGELTARIGADISGLERGIKNAERAMRGMQRNMSAIGDTLSRSLTLPVIGFGAIAIKAFADADKQVKALETTMQAAGYGASAAQTELEALRKAALAPGLDFEQAVQGSVRLQNVGFSAEKSREILVQLANAIAMTGGNAAELDRVTRQFGQMISKGRILQEDLTIIQENMPAIGAAMEAAFGTKSAERLREMGVSAEVFASKVTAQLALLPRVSGGIGNAITNAGVAIKQALATVGKSIDQTFGVTGKLDAFAAAVMRGAGAFSNMSEGSKSLVVGIALFAAALGPSIKLVTGFQQVVGLAYTSVLRLGVGLKTIQAGGFLAYWNTLNTAMKASIIGAIAAAVIALGVALKALEKDTSAAALAQKAVVEAGVEAKKSIAAEKLEAEKLGAVLQSETATREEKRAAMARLSAIAPEIFKNLDTEKIKVDEVNKALSQYIAKIEQRAKLAALNQKLVETEQKLYETQAGLNEEVKPDNWDRLQYAVVGYLSKGEAAAQLAKGISDRYKEQTATLETTKNKLLEEIAALEKGGAAQGALARSTATATAATKAQGDEFDRLIAAQEKSAAAREKALKAATALGIQPLDALPTPEIGAQFDFGDISAINTGLSAMNELLTTVSANMVVAKDMSTQFYAALEAGVPFVDVMNAAMTQVNQSTNLAGQIALAAGSAMAQAAQQGAVSLKKLALAAVGAAAQIIRAYIMEGVAASVSKALKGVPFPFNIAAGAAAGAITGALFNAALSKIGVPALAGGGVAYGPTMALVGDNKNAGVDPEVIAPLSALKDMIGGGGTVGEFTVRGTDLVLVLERANQRNVRTRGYQ